MSDKSLKRIGYPIGDDEWLVYNNTGAAIAEGDVVAISIGLTLDTAIAVTTANLSTIIGVAREACLNDATKKFRVEVQGVTRAKIPTGVVAGGLLVAANASVALAAWVSGKAQAIALEANASGSTALRKVILNGFSFAVAGATTFAGSITDPGNAGAIAVIASGTVQIVTAGAETRTIAAPTAVGQEMLICMKTDGGDAVITVATGINQAGNNTITLNDAGDSIRLNAIANGANIRWRVVYNDGCTLATV